MRTLPTVDLDTLTDAQRELYVKMTRVKRFYTMSEQDRDITPIYGRGPVELVAKKGSTLNIKPWKFNFNSIGCYAHMEVMTFDKVLYVKVHIEGQDFVVADYYRPSNKIGAKDIEFLLAHKMFMYKQQPSTLNISPEELTEELLEFADDYDPT